MSSIDEKDDECLAALRLEVEPHGLELSRDGQVKWQKSNPNHPRNWSASRKAYDTTVILLLELVTTMNGTAGTPAADAAQQTYGIQQSLAVFIFTSTYILGQGIGGIFFPPFSELVGRKTLYITSSLLYCIFCVIAAAVPSVAATVVARFVTGVLSAIPTIVVAGSIEDVFNIRARVWMIFVWTTIGNVALSLGPIFSTYVSDALGWQWVFYIAAIAVGVISFLCLFIRESRPSLLLERRVAAIRKTSAMPDALRTQNPDHAPNAKAFFDATIMRPLRLLVSEPIVIMVTAIDGVATVLFYLQAESLLVVYTSFGFTRSSASLAQIPVTIGCLLGFLPRFYDSYLLKKRRKENRPIEPEDKLFGFLIGIPVLAVALWWFAWTIPPAVHTHWIVSMIALVFIGFSMNDIIYVMAGYLADSYTIFAGSAFAGNLLARSLMIASIMPFSQLMYTNVSPNIATTILAVVSTVFCISPFVLLGLGERIRASSPFAKFSLDAYMANQVEDDLNMGSESSDL